MGSQTQRMEKEVQQIEKLRKRVVWITVTTMIVLTFFFSFDVFLLLLCLFLFYRFTWKLFVEENK